MRTGGKILATVLDRLSKHVMVGMNTQALADFAAKELQSLGGKPAFLGYYDFPDVLCVSVNDEVVHGIPKRSKVINSGDIVSMDFGVLYDGLITDAAISVIVGKAKPGDEKLVETTKKSLYAGIKAVKSGVYVGDISAAIEKILTANNYGIVRDLVGHGVGHKLHEDPNIPNYGHKRTGSRLEKSMTIAIEPMATLGDWHVYTGSDGWTVNTKDGSRSAHFEHTVLITDSGAEILTQL
ncbi:MAG TPA: type I methionyl aminopeptidase [Patescibacteria group bacterium]|nr:type I methionyl aminopeptidase [Patescibacteria group bacterium]